MIISLDNTSFNNVLFLWLDNKINCFEKCLVWAVFQTALVTPEHYNKYLCAG